MDTSTLYIITNVQQITPQVLPSATSTSIPSPEPLLEVPPNSQPSVVGDGWVWVLVLILFYRSVVAGGNRP